jgi:hypothetical protein
LWSLKQRRISGNRVAICTPFGRFVPKKNLYLWGTIFVPHWDYFLSA